MGKKLKITIILTILVFTAATALFIIGIIQKNSTKTQTVEKLNGHPLPDYVIVDLIDIDGHARRGEALEALNNIVIHYVANPMTTAQANRNYFNNPETTVSSHFVIGLEGEIIQCVPLCEKSSASNERNRDTISIEVCHEDETGKFNEKTYQSLIKLSAWLCTASGLTENDLIRHYDITGKNCPKYYVENPSEWEQLKEDVKEEIKHTKLPE